MRANDQALLDAIAPGDRAVWERFLAKDAVYVHHRRDGDHLVASREGAPSATLAQETTDVFFVSGRPRERKIFRRDDHNKIIDFVDRREGEDLVFVRGE